MTKEQKIEVLCRKLCEADGVNPDKVIAFNGHNPNWAGKPTWEVNKTEAERFIVMYEAMQALKETE